MKHTKLVLQRLREKQLYAKMSKCTFGVQEVQCLGLTLQAARIAMNKNKAEAIEAWETPKYRKELQSFLGLTVGSFCSPYISSSSIGEVKSRSQQQV